MQNIQITRYSRPKAHGWAGYIEPEDRSWIAFVGLDGVPRFFLHRDAISGAVLPDDPDERADYLVKFDEVRGDPGVATGMAEHHSEQDGALGLAVGERVFPFGVDGRGAA